MVKSHVIYATFRHFREGIENNDFKCEVLKSHLRDLCRLFAIYDLTSDNQILYEQELFKQGTMKLLNQSLK